MKAKEYAQRIIAEPDNQRVLENVLTEFFNELMQVCSARGKSTVQMLAFVREQFTKWKAIVRQVNAALPDYLIDDKFYPKLLGEFHSYMFALAMENKVFLGYEFDAADFQAKERGVQRAREYQEREMLQTMRNMGIR